uniref:60S ribosomal protein L7a n=1 Tax=Cucumis melo TaxID=3656 RepID=A0A9I9E8K1_CUCME
MSTVELRSLLLFDDLGKLAIDLLGFVVPNVVHIKTASILCLTVVKNEDKMEFSRILEAIKANFNKYDEYRKKWGGGIMGSKSGKPSIWWYNFKATVWYGFITIHMIDKGGGNADNMICKSFPLLHLIEL